MMTRKQYWLAIDLMEQYDFRDIEQITYFLIDFFKNDNPRFADWRFVDAVNKRYSTKLESPVIVGGRLTI